MNTPLPTHVILFSICILTLLAGCQTTGRIVDVTPSAVCPTCETQVRRLPVLSNLTYRKHICPSCKSVRDYGEDDDYDNLYVSDIIHVCDRCEAMVEMCPLCRDN